MISGRPGRIKTTADRETVSTMDWSSRSKVRSPRSTLKSSAQLTMASRRGIPLYVFEIHSLDSKTIASYEKLGATTTFSKAKTDGKTSPGLLRLFALYENLTRFNQVFCTQLQDREFPGTPITMSTNIVDISHVSLRQFWNLKGHMQAASQLATAHYPETLDRELPFGACALIRV